MTKINTQIQRGKTPEQRFWEKVSVSDGCWDWQSAIGTRGYGLFWKDTKTRTIFAHRYSYELHHGPIPAGAVIMHSCDNPSCVNPWHLSAGTVRENALDAKAKGRLAAGERNNGGNKLTNPQVLEIMSLKGVVAGRKVGERFNVSKTTVQHIWAGKIWNCVTGLEKAA